MSTEAVTNQRTIREYVCAQCWGPLVEKFIDGAFTVVCPKNCQPGGFVTHAYAARRKTENLDELEQVRKNYPQLRPETTNTDCLFQDD